jgi:hypothetical protein
LRNHKNKTIEYLKKLQFKPHNFNIVYRLHPFSVILPNIFARISALSNITVSQPVSDEKTEVRISQILESDLIISLYSTVLLEASILNKKCIIPSFLLQDFSVSGANYIDDSSHYSGMSLLNNVYNARTEKNFTDIFKIESNDLCKLILFMRDPLIPLKMGIPILSKGLFFNIKFFLCSLDIFSKGRSLANSTNHSL